MSYYVWGSNLSYPDYLTTRSFSDDISSATREAGKRVSMAISQQARDIIVSNEALANENIRVMNASTDRITGALQDGFSQLSYELQDISTGISELNATFHWGFSQMLTSIGRMNDTLSELIKIAKTPAQTAAYEQYEIARDAFRQGLYMECLEALDKAIAGDHTSPGYKLEWRFHQMKATIKLGFAGGDNSLMDLAKAEEIFLLAARYAKADYPEHAGQAFLSAGWAAYCQGKMKEALAHTENAVAVYPRLGEAFFQQAKIRMAIGEVDTALLSLNKAIDLDPFYALKAAGDGDFQKHDSQLCDFLDVLRRDKHRQNVSLVLAALKKLQFWTENSTGSDFKKAVLQLEAFVADGVNWPIMDILNVARNLSSMITGVEALPLSLKIKGPEVTKAVEETYPAEETYYEEIVIKPRSLFRKAVTDKQQRTRTLNKIRTVTKNYPGAEIEIEFCYIAAGTFIMGEGNGGHQVTLTKGFRLGKYPVTQTQWEAIMGENPSKFKGAEHPVERVSWNDAQEFVKRVNAMMDGKFRLPSEAEWEYACRAGTKTDDHRRLNEYAWYVENSGIQTHPVGLKKPNAWGLYDMYGNVWEWCEDWYGDYPSGSMTDPQGPNNGQYRVLRGGSWDSGSTATYRSWSPPGHRYYCNGFRLASTL